MQGNIQQGRQSWRDRWFAEHPRSLGMSWAAHGVGAIAIGAKLIGAGAACIVHAIVPGLFTDTAGKTVIHMYDHMKQRRAGAVNPENWPEYEI
jgi:hypothetical protein